MDPSSATCDRCAFASLAVSSVRYQPPILDSNFSDNMGGGNRVAGTYWAGPFGTHDLARTSNGVAGSTPNTRKDVFYDLWTQAWPGRSFDAPS